MSAAMNVVAAPAAAGVAAVAPAGGMALHVALHVACEVFVHVFGDGGGEVTSEVYDEVYDAQTARLARMIDPQFLAECGWDPAGRVLAPPADHRQLRSDRAGPAPAAAAGVAGMPGAGCAVSGCARPAGAHGLCRAHRRGQLLRGVSVVEFAADPARRALSSFGRCQVAACPQERRGGRVAYCETHQARWTRDHRADPGLDEAGWRAITAPIVVTGQVSLAGLAPLLTVQVLYGLQQRSRSGAQTRLHVLRAVVHDLRRSQAASVHAAGDPSPGMRREKHTVLAALARHAGLATADPETETAKDVWELAVFGLPGRLSFTAICQPWLRETVKRWAADELPRHRGAGAGRWCAPWSAAWRTCHAACGAAGPTTATGPPRWAAGTSNRSCTGWPTWPRPARSAPSSARRSVGTSNESWPGSGRSG